MKPIHVCLILGLRVSPIVDEFLFADLEHIINFRMRQFTKKRNTYGLKEIGRDLKQAKLERYHDDVLRLNLLKVILSFLLPNKGRNAKVKYVNLVDDLVEFNRFPWINHIKAPAIGCALIIGDAPVVGAPVIGSSSSAIEIEVVVLKQVAHRDGLEVVKDLMVQDEVEIEREVYLEAISSEYGGDCLETMEVAKVAKTEVVFFNQENDVDKAYQTSVDQTTAISVEEQVMEVINVYIKALIQYFDSQHRAHLAKEKNVLTDVYSYQIIDRAYRVWTRIMSSPGGLINGDECRYTIAYDILRLGVEPDEICKL
ncbi:hypothetical protein GIB67_012297 [Kingdonia uniflora]|uniref:Uncharacterized protein n=1 Tax=Kingdonia uniflora TaxID=39325 RepID=A0A7J7MVT1_9MAGN|nr:hypothetical protein GIB67_012297 [Kingdonia uniflora]